MRYEYFTKPCNVCHGFPRGKNDESCQECRGMGITTDEYIVYCSYESRNECEYGGDCRYCEDAEPVIDY